MSHAIAIASNNTAPFSYYSVDGGVTPITRSVELSQDSSPATVTSTVLTAYLVINVAADHIKLTAVGADAGVAWQFSKNNSDWFTELTYENATAESVETIYIRCIVDNDGSVTVNKTSAKIKIEGWGVDEYGVEYLLDEDFEGTGTPTGWSSSNQTANYDYGDGVDETPLSGNRSLFAHSSTVHTSYTRFEVDSSQAIMEMYVSGKVKLLDVENMSTGRGFICLTTNDQSSTGALNLRNRNSNLTIGYPGYNSPDLFSITTGDVIDFVFRGRRSSDGTENSIAACKARKNGGSWTFQQYTDRAETAAFRYFAVYGQSGGVLVDDIQVTEDSTYYDSIEVT